MYRWAKDSDKAAVMKLWAVDFESYEPYYSWYFKEVYRPELTLCDFEGEALVAALQLAPYTLFWRGASVPICYVVGVITDPAYRGQGRGSALLRQAHERIRQMGYAASLLYTDIPEFYRPLGYEHCYWQQTLCLPVQDIQGWAFVQAAGGSLFERSEFERQGGTNPAQDIQPLQAHIPALAEIYQRMTARYDGYILRGERNWQTYLGEQTCDGARLLLWEKHAYVLYTLSSEQLHIIELGFSDAEALAAALGEAAQTARAAHVALLWHAPVDAPRLLPQIPGEYWALRPFVMVRATGVDLVPLTRPLWINEYT